MLTALHASHNTLIATLKDVDGVAVTGATVTVTIVREVGGTALVTAATMVDQSDGTYEYIIIDTLLPDAKRSYTAQVTADDGTSTRYAEIEIVTKIDGR